MAMITVKYDPQLQLEPIVDIMYSTKLEDHEKEPDGVGSPVANIDQTKVVGIVAPLIAFNGVVIQWAQIRFFELECTKHLPTVHIIAEDSNGLIKGLVQPQKDNLLRVQILPPFEDAYKKVDLPFYVTEFSINGETMDIHGVYKVPELYNSRLQAFGNISTYEMMDKAAKESKLGFASNINSVDDKRWMFCRNEPIKNLLEREIQYSGQDRMLLDYWVDWHNYLILADIDERYRAKDENLTVWTTEQETIDVSPDRDEITQKVDAIISNNPAFKMTQLHVFDYTPVNNTASNVNDGTDRVIEVYNVVKEECESILLQDGDIHQDAFISTVYAGECFGEFNYILRKQFRDAYKNKVMSQCIEVTLAHPVLGLERGNKVNFEWYDSNDILNNAKQENDFQTSEQPSDDEISIDKMNINKQVSGQYYIIQTTLTFNGIENDATGWKYKLLLGRPAEENRSYKE